MEKKTLEERYGDEILTDNTKLSKYEQCKDCIYQDDGTVYSNRYDKGSCQKYPYPKFKPIDVMMNRKECNHKALQK